MNGLVGLFVKIESEEDGGRYVVELGKRGPVRVREINVEKVSPPSKRSTRLAGKLEGSATAEAETPATKNTKKSATPASKAKARRPPAFGRAKAKAKSGVKKPGKIIAPKAATATGADPTVFVPNDHRIISDPAVEVKEEGTSKWRPCHVYKSLTDGRVVLWLGGQSYEGLPPSKPYRIKGLRGTFDGRNGQLLDGDGELVPTRRRPNA